MNTKLVQCVVFDLGRCAACRVAPEPRELPAALLQRASGGFDAVCHDCLMEIMGAADQVLNPRVTPYQN